MWNDDYAVCVAHNNGWGCTNGLDDGYSNAEMCEEHFTELWVCWECNAPLVLPTEEIDELNNLDLVCCVECRDALVERGDADWFEENVYARK